MKKIKLSAFIIILLIFSNTYSSPTDHELGSLFNFSDFPTHQKTTPQGFTYIFPSYGVSDSNFEERMDTPTSSTTELSLSDVEEALQDSLPANTDIEFDLEAFLADFTAEQTPSSTQTNADEIGISGHKRLYSEVKYDQQKNDDPIKTAVCWRIHPDKHGYFQLLNEKNTLFILQR